MATTRTEMAPMTERAPGVRLSPEELQLLRLLADGLPTDVVARRLAISPRTLRRRTREVCERIGVDTTVEALVWAARSGLI